MKKLIACLLVLALGANAFAKDKNEFRYEVVPMAVGTEGTTLIKVFSYAKSQKKAIEAGKKNAVHAVLFKGIPGANGVYSQPAMVKPSAQAQNKSFFDKFFKDGTYLRFVTLSSDGIVDPQDMMRVAGSYKIGVLYVVNKSDLRKYLEDNGIIAKLGNIF